MLSSSHSPMMDKMVHFSTTLDAQLHKGFTLKQITLKKLLVNFINNYKETASNIEINIESSVYFFSQTILDLFNNYYFFFLQYICYLLATEPVFAP